jgi:AAA+ ATPase superfamily predicted ATPase
MNALILGRRRQGKSTLALRLATQKHRTVIIFDPNSQYKILPSVDTVASIQEWLDRPGQKGIIAFQPSPGHIQEEFEQLCDVLWPYGNFALIVDEAASVQKSHSIHPSLERYIRQGPREDEKNAAGSPVGVSIFQTTHRMVDINPLSRALATDFFFFRTTLNLDLEYISKEFGEDIADKVTALPQHHVLHIWQTGDGGEASKTWSNPRVWYLPLLRSNERG